MPRRRTDCHRLEIQFRSKDWSAVERAADTYGLNITAWGRTVMLRAATRSDAAVPGAFRAISGSEAAIIRALTAAGQFAERMRQQTTDKSLQVAAQRVFDEIVACLAGFKCVP
jgi:hypothetical protein